jgi:hypothetical protein
MLKILALCCLALIFGSCYQIHSDDDLRTVPTTNNPNLIQDSNKSGLPSMGY